MGTSGSGLRQSLTAASPLACCISGSKSPMRLLSASKLGSGLPINGSLRQDLGLCQLSGWALSACLQCLWKALMCRLLAVCRMKEMDAALGLKEMSFSPCRICWMPSAGLIGLSCCMSCATCTALSRSGASLALWDGTFRALLTNLPTEPLTCRNPSKNYREGSSQYL